MPIDSNLLPIRRAHSGDLVVATDSSPPFAMFSWQFDQCLLLACAVKGGAFQWVQVPPGETLQPEATGAVMEVTKWLKPSV